MVSLDRLAGHQILKLLDHRCILTPAPDKPRTDLVTPIRTFAATSHERGMTN